MLMPNLRNLYNHNVTCSWIIELNDNKRAVPHFRGFFPKLGFFVGFSLYDRDEQRRISEAATGCWEARSAPFFVYLYFTTYTVGVKIRIEIENTFLFGKWEESLPFYLLFVLCSQTL